MLALIRCPCPSIVIWEDPPLVRARSNRLSFAKLPEVQPVPDLLAVQRESFDRFLESGLRQMFEEVSPIEDFTGNLALELTDHRFGDPTETIEEAKDRDSNYSKPLFVTARFLNRETGEIKEQQVFLGDFPMMTENGTFIINGTERVVVSQLVRSPGVYYDVNIDKTSDRDLYSGKIIPGRGAWLEFDIDKKETVGIRVDRKRRQFVTTFIRALDIAETDEEILALFDGSQLIANTLEKDPTENRDEALLDLYRKLRPGELTTVESARGLINTLFSNPKRYDLTRVGRYKLNQKLGLPPIDLDNYSIEESGMLSEEDIVASIKYLIALHNGEEGFRIDDIDNFQNRRVRTVGELIQNQIRVGLSRLERVVRERMTTQDPEAITPQTLINIRPVVASIKEFFGTSQLSQFMDQPNPLASLTHRRRLSALGPGGLSRERAGFEVRDVHPSHYGRMCPIETPEGPNIGLIGSLASYAKVNRFGFIETPYRRVVKGKVTAKIDYLTASEEEGHVIAQANALLKDDGSFLNDRILVRKTGGQVDTVPPKEVDYMDVSPKQLVSVSTALIPFLEHDDANRALMGSNMQRQAVPLITTDAPLVGTGMESRAARDSGDVVLSPVAGEVLTVTGDEIVVKEAGSNKRHTFRLQKFERSNQGTNINQKPVVREGDKVREGSVLADGPSTDNGELALGQNLLVAFMPWNGHNFEDAIILSERLVKDDVLTSIHIEEHEIEARDTKLGAEEITRDIPNVAEEVLSDLDDRGIIRIGAEVGPGDYLVGKITPKGETELTPEERLLRAIFGEKAREVRDVSLKVPHGETGKAIAVKEFRRDEGYDLPPGMNELVRVYVAKQRKISEGDKLAGRHGNKGVIAKILPEEDMPFLEDGTPVDIILSPLGVPSRMNLGQVLETHLGWAAAQGWEGFDDLESPAAKGAPPWTTVASPVFDGAHEDEILRVLEEAKPNRDGEYLVNGVGKATLIDGRSGEPFDSPITVGYMYIMKLVHLVDDKIHARSTGPYSMITQQPLGGKAQFGGQRFGEMEVWALEAYGAAYALQEVLTIKSDDVRGRVKVYEAIVKGENIPEPGIPESFKVLVKEMQSLGLNVEMLSAGEEIEFEDLEEDVFRTAASLGIDISRPEKAEINI
jgi:DNA-directed RNA polymerase subunit beta